MTEPDSLQTAHCSVRDALRGENVGKRVRVQGWVRTKRTSKAGVTFVEINDGSCLQNVQVVISEGMLGYNDIVPSLSTGASATVDGDIVESPAQGQDTEISATFIEVVGTAPDYPLAKKRHSFEYLRTVAHLRPRTNTFGAVARVRNEVCRSIHSYFQARGYLYIQTPIITSIDAEGAGQMFQVTSFDLQRLPLKESMVDVEQELFGKATHLTVSGQLQAEIMAMAMSSVYTFGPTFRAENSNTSRHLAEFWMIEPEIAFCDLTMLMNVAEEFLKTVFTDVLSNCADDIKFFNDRVDDTVLQTLQHIAVSDFVRLTYTEAVEILQRSGQSFEFPVEWGSDLQAEHERFLTESEFKRPVILTDYPAGIKAFYMRLNPDDRTVAAMDVLVPKIGEIIGGSQREERLDVLTERMKSNNIDPEDYWWYLDLRRFGTTPHAGFGLGLERIVQFITGMGNIRDVIPFPRTPKNVDF